MSSKLSEIEARSATDRATGFPFEQDRRYLLGLVREMRERLVYIQRETLLGTQAHLCIQALLAKLEE